MQKMLIIFTALLVSVAFTGCSSAFSPTPSQTGISSLTTTQGSFEDEPVARPTTRPDSRPSDTPTAEDITSITPTPKSPSTAGTEEWEKTEPYLAYIRQANGEIELVFANPGGAGRKAIPLPESNNPGGYIDGVSPDGRYYAYHTGSMDVENGEVILRIMRLDDGAEIISIPLTSEDFRDQMLLGRILVEDPPEDLIENFSSFGELDAEQIAYEGIYAAQAGIRSMEWSPDGKFLAFAAQIHGPTTDLYVYEVKGGGIRRLTSGPTQIQFVDWSPDGHWIAHGSTYSAGMNIPMNFNFASPNGEEIFRVETEANLADGWYGSEIYLASAASNSPGEFNISSLSVHTRRANTLWRYPFAGYVIDLSIGKMLVFVPVVFADEEGSILGPDTGIYSVDFNDGSIQPLDGVDPTSFIPWRKQGEFALFVIDDDIHAMDNSGETRLLIAQANLSGPTSPDGNWIMYTSLAEEGVQIQNVETGRRLEFPDGADRCVQWMPSSSGFIYKLDDRLYFANLEDGETMLVDEETIGDRGDCETRWMPAK